MVLMNIVQNLLRDNDPLKDGFQPSIAYIITCLILPLATGIVVGIATGYLRKIFKPGE